MEESKGITENIANESEDSSLMDEAREVDDNTREEQIEEKLDNNNGTPKTARNKMAKGPHYYPFSNGGGELVANHLAGRNPQDLGKLTADEEERIASSDNKLQTILASIKADDAEKKVGR